MLYTKEKGGVCNAEKENVVLCVAHWHHDLKYRLYIAIMRNARTTYANGKFVEQEGTDNEVRYYLLKIGTK